MILQSLGTCPKLPETQKRTRATSMQPNDPEDLIDQAEEFLPSFQCRFEDILLTLPHICTQLKDTDRPMCSVYETDTGHMFPCVTLKVIMQWPGSESQHTMLCKQVDADTDAQKLYQVGPFDFLIPEEQCIDKKHTVINHSREDADGQGDAVYRTAKRQIKTAGTFLLPACIWSVPIPRARVRAIHRQQQCQVEGGMLASTAHENAAHWFQPSKYVEVHGAHYGSCHSMGQTTGRHQAVSDVRAATDSVPRAECTGCLLCSIWKQGGVCASDAVVGVLESPF